MWLGKLGHKPVSGDSDDGLRPEIDAVEGDRRSLRLGPCGNLTYKQEGQDKCNLRRSLGRGHHQAIRQDFTA